MKSGASCPYSYFGTSGYSISGAVEQSTRLSSTLYLRHLVNADFSVSVAMLLSYVL
ncbi:hypothetical protein [Photorhabdus sp. P32]|uniref:hypothetical protein n=1 Tax=Photorhabdus sp. P32 TaxID=3117549 RepID=UPI0040540090